MKRKMEAQLASMSGLVEKSSLDDEHANVVKQLNDEITQLKESLASNTGRGSFENLFNAYRSFIAKMLSRMHTLHSELQI